MAEIEKKYSDFQKNECEEEQKIEVIDEKLRLVEKIKHEEVPEGVNMATWALAWCLQHPAVTTVIPWCKNPEQVEANAKAADLSIVSDQHPSGLNK